MVLFDIKNTVQEVAEAIAAVMEVEVTIIDNKFNRVAASGQYKSLIGKRIPSNSIFEKVATEGIPKYVCKAQYNAYCRKCSAQNICTEVATLGFPIVKSEKVIGIIGINAFEEEQRENIADKYKSYLFFLDKLSNLIVGNLSTYETLEKLMIQTEETNEIIDSFKYGILCTDNNGIVKYINRRAELIFDLTGKKAVNMLLKDIIPDLDENILKIKQKEIKLNNHPKSQSIIIKNNPILFQGQKVSNILEIHKTTDVVRDAYKLLESKKPISFDDIIGESENIKKVKNIAKHVAISDSTVSLYGESGTGKELFARAIHCESLRRDEPFIAINCASIPDNLLESELFGYEGGSFSGAKRDGQMGKFELADGGTIFLDEIGDMPLHLQPKILRVLQERCFTRIGGKNLITVDVRLIAATNKNLEKMITNGEFREDLYYRLNVIPIMLPPLRERGKDVLLLSNILLEKYCLKLNTSKKQFSDDLKEFFIKYNWPGNIRELENVIEYLINTATGDIITPQNLPESIKQKVYNINSLNNKTSLKEQMEQYEKWVLTSMLKKYGQTTDSKEKISKLLDINLSTFYRKLNKYGLE